MKAIEEAGGKPFFDYQVPSAVLTLKQGFGRLIRSLEDRGVLVLLDPRIRRQRYGQTFLQSLPPVSHDHRDRRRREVLRRPRRISIRGSAKR
jgi:Rad3-related DNA helicase